MWMLADEDYLDYDGFTVFPNREGSLKKRTQVPFPQRMEEHLEMFNYETHLQCLIDRLEEYADGGDTWSDGWETTQKILTNHSKAKFLSFHSPLIVMLSR